jgi:diaminohydroxyphosphoribosylaminopyrimidine deaminase/5-amino-6-(5-phosphoribosylamino)uracil reductase
VGCVIIKNGIVLGRGWTQPGGRPHAETMALDQAGAAAKGATAYVTLEPCAHHGKTPPCVDALIAAGIARVVSAVTDPDPRVSGKGHDILSAAGVMVTTNVMFGEARLINAGFFNRITTGLPFATLKLAMSLDGRIANAKGASRWITGPLARRHVHAQRAMHDAVLVGIGTVLADDPDLTVRDMGKTAQPIRIVIDSHLRFPLKSKLALTAGQTPVWICHAEAAPVSDALKALMGVKLIPCALGADGRVDLRDAFAQLGAAGLTRIYCEGGGAIAASLLQGRLAHELIAFHAGHVFGSEGTPGVGPVFAGPRLNSPDYVLSDVARIGDDIMHHWRLREM